MPDTPYPRSDRELLSRISRSSGGKAGYKQLIRELGLGGGRQRRLLLEQLTRMVARGELQRLEDGLWAVPRPVTDAEAQSSTSSNSETYSHRGRERLTSGRLDLHRDGFGFVRVERERGSTPQGDIFVSPHDLNGAMQGDLVLVDEAPPNLEGRRAGRIARVLTRGNPTLVGIFHYARTDSQKRRGRAPSGSSGFGAPLGNFVKPIDERIAAFVEIPEGAEVVATSPGSVHRTVGGEARQTRATDRERDTRWPLEGLAVDIELTHFPAPGRPARGRVIEVLGHPDDFGVDVEIVIRKHHLPHVFPPAVLAEAEDRSALTVERLFSESPAEFAFREDFRDLPVVTIDGETARDFDDAVLVRPLPNGNVELQVHIADVSAYVLPGSALDTEARVRGTSVYFPDRAVPMLPGALSSGMCSLRPNEDRLVQSCLMEIDGRGEVVGYRVCEGVIRSVRRCTYTSVQHCLNASTSSWGDEGGERGGDIIMPEATAEDFAERERIGLEQPGMPDAFDRMLDLALKLNAKRVRRGSIDFDLPEPVVAFDPEGNMKAIVRSERGWAHRLIEEFMLSANECVATWLAQQDAPSIYRIHEMPDAKRILEFEELAASFGQTLGVGAIPVKRLTMKSDRRESQRRSMHGRERSAVITHEIPNSIPVTPQMYQRLVKRIAGKPEERILSYMMLRSLKQARYAEQNEGHFALASPCYTHFTSPIRRYPDLLVHRLLRAKLRSGDNPRGGSILSTDRQPWQQADLPRRERHAGSGARHSVGPPSAAKITSPNKEARRGRVGWSTSEQTRLSLEGKEGNAGLPESSFSTAPLIPVELYSAAELSDMAVESSQAERRAADAERELIEWKKMRFMADKVGDDFRAIILSVTKYGFFVELDDMFIEGLVPIGSLVGDRYAFRETDRTICGARTGHCFTPGQSVEVILDRIDRQARRLQFALLPGTEPQANTGIGPVRKTKSEKKKARSEDEKSKGKRKKR